MPEQETSPDYRGKIKYSFKCMAVQAEVIPEMGEESRVFQSLRVMRDCNQYEYDYEEPETRPANNSGSPTL